MKKWSRVTIQTSDGPQPALAPVIISASRSTDIPAFFSGWLHNRLKAGYMRWTNPFNAKQVEFVSFQEARAFVFWSKNPRPLMQYLPEFDARGINYYFQFTVNNYEKEGLEPNVPPLASRIRTFQELSRRIGKKKVIWRYDPLILTDSLNVESLTERIAGIAEQLRGFTEKLVVSFADIGVYAKVCNNLKRENISYREFTPALMSEAAQRLQELNRRWGLKIASCAEGIDLASYDIVHNRCVDDELMIELFRNDAKLMAFLGYEPGLFDDASRPNLKDKGQRKECGCIISKDIGRYDTCSHLCAYCYANTSRTVVSSNLRKHRPDSDALVSQVQRSPEEPD